LNKEKIKYADADIAQHLSWIKREIKKEAFISVFGLTEGLQGRSRRGRTTSEKRSNPCLRRGRFTRTRVRIIAQRTAGMGTQQQQ